MRGPTSDTSTRCERHIASSFHVGFTQLGRGPMSWTAADGSIRFVGKLTPTQGVMFLDLSSGPPVGGRASDVLRGKVPFVICH